MKLGVLSGALRIQTSSNWNSNGCGVLVKKDHQQHLWVIKMEGFFPSAVCLTEFLTIEAFGGNDCKLRCS